MERTITIKRLKHFAGSLIIYLCVLDTDIEAYKSRINNKDDADDYGSNFKNFLYPITNGKEITIDIDDKEHKIFIVADTSTSTAFSNEIIIDPGTSDYSYEIKTKYNFFK